MMEAYDFHEHWIMKDMLSKLKRYGYDDVVEYRSSLPESKDCVEIRVYDNEDGQEDWYITFHIDGYITEFDITHHQKAREEFESYMW